MKGISKFYKIRHFPSFFNQLDRNEILIIHYCIEELGITKSRFRKIIRMNKHKEFDESKLDEILSSLCSLGFIRKDVDENGQSIWHIIPDKLDNENYNFFGSH